MRSAALLLSCLLSTCAALPETVGVSAGISQGVVRNEATSVNVAVIPVWRIKPAPVAKVADSTGTLGTTPPTPSPR